ncbi:metal-binding protein, partial [Mesorhizobium sp. M2A.F.Ca.ET.046.02.1.1]
MDRNGSFPANIADISSEPDASDGVTVIVCSSCRDETGSDAHPRAGALLAEGTRRAASGENIRIRT